MLRRGLCLLVLSVPFFPAVARAQDLQAPPPLTPQQTSPTTTMQTTQTTATTQQLNESERKDSGRNFELVWIDGQVNGSYINMSSFSSKSFAIEKTSSAGPAFSVGAGIRLLLLVLGARIRYNALSSFNLWQANAEVGVKVPIRAIDFLLNVHGGYAWVGSLGDANRATDTSTPTSNDAVSIRGFNAGLETGLDYYVTPLFSVGLGAMADFLYLNRPAIDKPAGLTAAQQQAVDNDPLYKRSGSTAGIQIGGGLRLGVHFGL